MTSLSVRRQTSTFEVQELNRKQKKKAINLCIYLGRQNKH